MTHAAQVGRGVTAAAELDLGQRDVAGHHPSSEFGKLTVDGSRLDTFVGPYVIASSWRDPACEFQKCIRAAVARMVPDEYSYCPQHGRPKLPDEDPYPLEGDERRRADDRAWSKLASRYGILNRDQWASFETAKRTPAIAAVDAYAHDDGFRCTAMLLQGGVGTGKSTALACYVRECVVWSNADVNVFHPFPSLVSRLLDSRKREATLQSCREADVLVWDDMGSSYTKPGGLAAGLIEEVIVFREAQQYELLASTNLSPAKFRTTFGERVFDRLRGEWGTWMNVDGPSLRRKRGARA